MYHLLPSSSRARDKHINFPRLPVSRSHLQFSREIPVIPPGIINFSAGARARLSLEVYTIMRFYEKAARLLEKSHPYRSYTHPPVFSPPCAPCTLGLVIESTEPGKIGHYRPVTRGSLFKYRVTTRARTLFRCKT